MKKILLLLFIVSIPLAGCASKQALMDKKKRINEAHQNFISTGAVKYEAKDKARVGCTSEQIKVYENTSGTENERYEKGEQVYKNCMANKGYKIGNG